MLTKKIFQKVIDSGYIGYVIPDKGGNQLILHKDSNVGLKIKSEHGRERNLGAILDDVFYTVREEKHIFRKSNSIGFNYHLLKDTALFTNIMVQVVDKYYQVPKDTVLQFGKCMNFKEASDDNDFELQIFFSLEILKTYEL
jgi:hypothetical protein